MARRSANGTTHTGPKRVVIYTRVSRDPRTVDAKDAAKDTANESDPTSLDTQHAACVAYAEREGYAFVVAHSDTISGAIIDRPGLGAVREMVRARACDVVLCYAVDRLARKQTHTAILIDEMERHDVRPVFVTESFEDNAVGQFILSAKAFAGELEREKITERTGRGKRAKANAGKSVGGRPAYGYRWQDKEHTAYEIVDDQAQIVRRIFEDVAQGSSMRDVTRALNSEGIVNASGGSWGAPSISFVLHNPVYIGDLYSYRYKREKNANGKINIVLRPESEWIRSHAITVPPIVTRETWDRVGVTLAHNKAWAGRHDRYSQSHLLFGGIAVCAYCGSGLVASTRSKSGGASTVYRCGRWHRQNGDGVRDDAPMCDGGVTVQGDWLDAAVWFDLDAFFRDPDMGAWLDREFERWRGENGIGKPSQRVEQIEREIAEIDRKIARLVKRMSSTDDDVIADAVQVEITALSARRRVLDAERGEQESVRVDSKAVHDRFASVQAILLDVREWSNGMIVTGPSVEKPGPDWSEKRELIERLGVRVTVYRATDQATPRRGDQDARYEIALVLGDGGRVLNISSQGCVQNAACVVVHVHPVRAVELVA